MEKALIRKRDSVNVQSFSAIFSGNIYVMLKSVPIKSTQFVLTETRIDRARSTIVPSSLSGRSHDIKEFVHGIVAP